MKTIYPDLPCTIGKRGTSVMPPDGRKIKFVVVDEVRCFQDSNKDKILLLQLMQFGGRKREVRVGYYIIGKLPKMKGKWVWGQFAAFMPLRIFEKLVRGATKKGWFNGSSLVRPTVAAGSLADTQPRPRTRCRVEGSRKNVA